MSYAKMTVARQRVGYTPATGRILLRRRVRGMLGKTPVLTLSSTGETMTSTTAHHAPTTDKRQLTAFELLLLAPFGLLLWHVETQPLVLPAAPPSASVAEASGPAAAPVAPVDPDAPVFVTAGTTVLQRIAPVARVTLEGQEAPTAVTEPVPVQTVSVAAEAAPAATAPAPAPDATASVLPQAAASVRIEITDGTGVDGFAKDVAAQLEKSGVTVLKAGTMAAGSQRRNVILYRDGFEEDAARLGKLFARPPALVNNTRSRNATDTSDVRLVLGSAAAREKSLLASSM